MVCQLVIDVAGELSARRGDQFQDYTQAIRNLARDPSFPSELIRQLERLPGFRNVVIHEYVALDMDRVVETNLCTYGPVGSRQSAKKRDRTNRLLLTADCLHFTRIMDNNQFEGLLRFVPGRG